MSFDMAVMAAQMVHELIQTLIKKGIITQEEYTAMLAQSKKEVARKMTEANQY